MSHKLYTKLGESFDIEPAQLSGYRTNGVPYQSIAHYNIRSFHTDLVTRNFTEDDSAFWENFRYQDYSIGEPRSITGQELVNRDMASLNPLNMGEMDGMTMFQLNYAETAVGNEEWTTGAGITLGRDAANRYMNRLEVSLGAAESKVINSYHEDDILTGLEGDYNIELTLFNFSGTGLDLANSWLDFSTDNGFSVENTASLRFSQTLTDLSGVSAGTETKARWSRSALTGIDLTQIKAVRLRLTGGAAPFTFITNAMRVLPNNGDAALPNTMIDTKRGNLIKAPSRNGEMLDAATTYMYFDKTRPKNVKVYARFNTGHNPVGNDNTIQLAARAEGSAANDYRVQAELNARNTQSRLHIVDITPSGSTTTSSPINTNILSENTDYIFVLEVDDVAAKATIYAANGINLGAQVYTITAPVTRLDRGYVGWNFTPYNQDFTLDYVQANDATFASFLSTSFNSLSWVRGASLYVDQSPPAALLEDAGEPLSWGDATLTRLSSYDSVTRDGTEYQGGIVYEEPFMMGTGQHAYIRGKIWPEGVVNGTYRIALVDEYDSVAFLVQLSDLLPNRWNDFEIAPHEEVFTMPLFLHVQQQGYHADTFRLSEVRVDHNVLAWEASVDDVQWQSFLDTINKPYGAVHFAIPGKSVRLRATAYSDQAWISGYKLIPRYTSLFPQGQINSSTEREVRLYGPEVQSHAVDVRLSASGVGGSVTPWEFDPETRSVGALTATWPEQVDWDNDVDGTASVDTTIAGVTGTKSALFTVPTSTAGQNKLSRYWLHQTSWPQDTDLWCGCAFYLPSNFYTSSQGDVAIVTVADNYGAQESTYGTWRIRIWYDRANNRWGLYKHRDFGPAPIARTPLITNYIDAASFTTDTWHRIDVRVKLHNTDGQAINELWFNDSKIGESTTSNYPPSDLGTPPVMNETNAGIAAVSANVQTNALSLRIDDYYVDNSRQGGAPDTTPPTVTSRTVDTSNLDIVYNEVLNTSVAPATSAFAVVVAGSARGVSSVTFPNSNTVRLALASPVAQSEVVTVAYTIPGSNPLRDTAGNNAATYAAQSVTNNTGVIPFLGTADNFNDNTIGGHWTNYGAQVTETISTLRITTTTASNYYSIRQAAGDFTGKQVSVELPSGIPAAPDSLEVNPIRIIHGTVFGNRYEWYINRWGDLRARKSVGGTVTNIITGTFNATNHRWLRIREQSGTIYWDTSLNGTSWTNFASTASGDFVITSMYPQIEAGTWQAEASTATVVFDNFNI